MYEMNACIFCLHMEPQSLRQPLCMHELLVEGSNYIIVNKNRTLIKQSRANICFCNSS